MGEVSVTNGISMLTLREKACAIKSNAWSLEADL